MACCADRFVDLPGLGTLLDLLDLILKAANSATLAQLFDLLLLLLKLRLYHRLIDILVCQRVHALLLHLQVRTHVRSSVDIFERPGSRPLGGGRANREYASNRESGQGKR